MATYSFDSTTVQTKEGQRSLLSRAFLYMFGLLIVTAVVSLVMHFIFKSTIDTSTTARNTYITLVTCASISQIVLTVVMMFTSIKSGKITIPAILYAACMGVLISSFSFILDWKTLTMAFAISALCFGGMALIGIISKNASGFAMVGFGLFFGIMMASLFNILMFFVFTPRTWAINNIITSILIVIAIMCITAYDVWQIKAISQRGLDTGNGNLAFYLAFNLYLDFIVIFLHIIRLLAMFASDRN